jgi:hypothetical protein
MDNLIIKPQVGIGEVKLGMRSQEVHEVMGNDFIKLKTGNIDRDCYYNLSFQIHYDNNIVNYIEVANSTAYSVMYENIDIFKIKANEFILYLNKSSKHLNTPSAQLGYMYVFEDLGISLSRSNVFNEETLKEQWFQHLSQEQQNEEFKFLYFESVSLWSKGYYNSINLYI